MGTSSSYKTQNYLSPEEINSTINSHDIQIIFNKYKHNNDYITLLNFNILTNFYFDNDTSQRLFYITSSNSKHIKYDDFKYLIALFYTTKYTAKLNFLCDFIFIKSHKIIKKDYLLLVNKYFDLSKLLLSIFLDERLLRKYTNDTSKIERSVVYSFIDSNYKNEINSFTMLKIDNTKQKENETNSQPVVYGNNISNVNTYVNDVKIVCKCSFKKSSSNKEMINESNFIILNSNVIPLNANNNTSPSNISNTIYDKIEKEFHLHESRNNGVFPIVSLEKMLEEINIIQSIINAIGNYLRKKTQKSYLNFNTLKDLLKCIHNSNSIQEFLFDILSYPKDYIKQNDLFIFMKDTNSSLSSEVINNFFKIPKIIRKTFNEGINKFIMNENIISSFENLKYLHYIFFNIKPNDKTIEKKCIEILLGDNSINEYIKERITKEKDFYIIDYLFWEKWNTYIQSPDTFTKKTQRQHTKKSLRINTSKISDLHGGLLEGLYYMSDYLLITTKMYTLFSLWYGDQLGPPLKRSKILLDHHNKQSKTNEQLTMSISSSLSLTEDNDNDSEYQEVVKYKQHNALFYGVDYKTGSKFEIEIYPIFLVFFTLNELILKHGSLERIKDFLKQQSNPKKSKTNYYMFSRQTKMTSLLKQLEDSLNKIFEQGKVRLWLYYQHKFHIVSLKGTLEHKGIINSAIFVLEIFSNNQWPIDKLNKKESSNEVFSFKDKKDKNKNCNPIFVGLTNIGNTCYMNSILQLLLNNNELTNLFINETFSKKKHNMNLSNTLNSNVTYTINNELINFLSNKHTKGKLIKEYLNLLIDKYKGEHKTINPKQFKNVCGKYNEVFKGSEQQDAHDFFLFLLDTLHEETNIKCNSNEVVTTSKDKNDNDNNSKENEYEHLLADQQWSNNIRNNASYIHSLYLGQLKSTLTCSQCHKSKISYETFSSLSLPIPEDSKMILDVLLFRLPFTLKPYYDSITSLTMNANANIRTSLKKIKANALTGLYATDNNTNNYNDNSDSESSCSYVQNSVEDNAKPTKEYKLTKLNTQYYNAQKQNVSVPNKNTNDALYANTLNVNIPICIKIEICKKDKCENIIKHIQNIIDLELEQTNTFTSFLITNNGKYIDESLTIAECFIEGQIAYVYELLTYKGIEKIFKYNTKYKEQINTNVEHIIKSELPLMIYNPLTYYNDSGSSTNNNIIINTNIPSDAQMDNQLKKSATIAKGETCSKKDLPFTCTLSQTINNNYNYEIILPIVHRSVSLKKNNVNVFHLINYEYLDTFYDYILLPNNSNCFRFKDLYEMIWEKYEYYLDMPIKVKNSLWWKNILTDNNNNNNNTNKNKQQGSYLSSSPLNHLNQNTKTASFINSNQNLANLLNNCDNNDIHNLKLCSPFVIKVINKKTKRCAFCPWLSFCSGCILGIHNTNTNITFTSEMVLVIEWCRNIYMNYIKTENIHRVFNHSSVNEIKNHNTFITNNNTKIQLTDCVDLFMQKEELNDIHCEKCQRKTMFKKNYEISRFPKHFIITLKRFKYTAYYRQKIHSLISFPLTDLDLSSHACEHINHHPLYDLYGIVNHSGSLNGGHYYSVIKQENAWIKYDDSSAYENKDDLESKNVYILVYQMKNENKNKMILNYKGLLETAYVLYKDNTFNEWDALFNYEVDKEKNKCKEIHGKCMLYYGEPVVVHNKGRGFVINVIKEGEQYYVSVKLDGVNNNNGVVKVKLKDVSKETIKVDYNDNESLKEEQDKNEVPVSKGKDDNKICGKCVIM